MLARQILYHLSHIPSPFGLVILGMGPHIYAGGGLDSDPAIYASCIAGMTGMHHCALVEMESQPPK
jgi:hypothetical protein